MTTWMAPAGRHFRFVRAGWIGCGWLTLATFILLPAAWSEPAERSVAETRSGPGYATPEEAVSALLRLARAGDVEGLRALFGLATDELVANDRVQATNELAAFAAASRAGDLLVRESDRRFVLEVGKDAWPFPVPIIERNGRWVYDTDAGIQELLNRRIGRNELAVLRVMRICVEAQREYASRDRDGDEVLEFAQKLSSSPGQTDGLYWPPELNGEISPLGPLIADAQSLGYFRGRGGEERPPEPFHGYYFEILTAQGRHAPGGKHSYLINGNMIAGFALVAWPADYGESGVMTFIVNQQGRVMQRDLGPETARLASRLKAYDPDAAWRLSPD